MLKEFNKLAEWRTYLIPARADFAQTFVICVRLLSDTNDSIQKFPHKTFYGEWTDFRRYSINRKLSVDLICFRFVFCAQIIRSPVCNWLANLLDRGNSINREILCWFPALFLQLRMNLFNEITGYLFHLFLFAFNNLGSSKENDVSYQRGGFDSCKSRISFLMCQLENSQITNTNRRRGKDWETPIKGWKWKRKR